MSYVNVQENYRANIFASLNWFCVCVFALLLTPAQEIFNEQAAGTKANMENERKTSAFYRLILFEE